MKKVIIAIVAWTVVLIGVICLKSVYDTPASIMLFVLMTISSALVVAPAFWFWQFMFNEIFKNER